jgi:hypothetical protein
MITLYNVLLEAENIDGSPEAAAGEDSENEATDYTDTGDEEMDTDTGETEEDAGADEGDDTGEDPAGADEDEGPDEGTDYTDEGTDEDAGDDTDEPPTDDAGMDNGDNGDSAIESEDQIKQRDAKVKSLMLLKEFNKLYYTVKDYISKVTSMDKKNLLFSAVQKTVITNFNKLATLVYNYIQFYYDHMSYEYNLYTYNYFIEMCKVNIELMNKVAGKDDVQYE